MKKLSSFQAVGAFMLLLALACFFTVACDEEGYLPAAQISIDAEELTMYVGKTAELNVTVVKSSRLKEYVVQWEYPEEKVTVSFNGKDDVDKVTVTKSSTITLVLTPIRQGNDVITIKFLNPNLEEDLIETLTCALTIGPAGPDTPTASPPGGSEVVSGVTTVTLTSTSGATIYYTKDGSTPTEDDIHAYSAPITINGTVTIKAFAAKDGKTSNIMTARYTVVASGTVAKPYADPPAGVVSNNQRITLASSTDGAEIHYTTDGSDPSIDSPVYSGSTTINISPTLTIIRAIAIKADMIDSEKLNAVYTISNKVPPAPDTRLKT